MDTLQILPIWYFWWSVVAPIVTGTACSGDTAGPDFIPTGAETTDSSDTITGYLMRFDGVVGCHGTIHSWEMDLTTIGCRRNIYFQVWRPSSGSFVLVAENLLDFPNRINLIDCGTLNTKGTKSWPVEEQYRIPVQQGDIIGWRESREAPPLFPWEPPLFPWEFERPFTFAPFGGFVSIQQGGGPCSFPPSAGDTCDWNAANTGSMRFSVNAHLGASNAPYFINLPDPNRWLWVNKGLPVGSLIYMAKALFEHNAQEVVNPRLIYSMAGGGSTYTIDPTTGEIRTALPVTETSTLTITATPEGWPVSASQTSVLRVNYDPSFDPVRVLEDPPNMVSINTANAIESSIGYEIQVITSTCEAPGVCSPAVCSIATTEPSFPPFSVGRRNDRDSYFIELNVDVRHWQFPEAYTAGIVCHSDNSITRVENLTVTLINMRTTPVSDLPFSVSIPEEPSPAGVITQVSGSYMPPVPLNRGGGLQYEIIKVFPPSYMGDFDIGQNTGLVSHTGSDLDFFKTRIFDLEIVVRDNDGLHSADPANLTIQLTWENRAPQFLVTSYSSIIPENSAIGTVLPDVILKADDRDIQADDWITYTLEDQGVPPLGAFKFSASNITSRVYVDKIITIDTPGVPKLMFNFFIKVVDSYGLPDPTQATLTVTVYDINDNAPVFTSKKYYGSVSESDFGPTYVTTVTATDDDAGDNARIIYSIVEREAQLYFSVGATSGKIDLIQPISYSLFPNISFTVKATDQGDPPLSSTATVTVNVKEVNSHEPVFDPVFYSVETRSDLPVGESVLQVSATDLDSGAVNRLAYYYLTIQKEFAILGHTGNVTVAKPLTAWERYNLYINVQDNGSPNLKSDPAYVRVDTFDAGSTLFDILLNLPLEIFLEKQDYFMKELNILLSPWTIIMERVLLDHDITVVTCYALSEVPSFKDMYGPKIFVHRNDVLHKLRRNAQGDPKNDLREPPFAEFEPIKVFPTFPNWWTETAGGQATLVILCILLAAAILLLCILLCKKNGWLCFDNSAMGKVVPVDTQHASDEFTLNYGPPPPKTEKQKMELEGRISSPQPSYIFYVTPPTMPDVD